MVFTFVHLENVEQVADSCCQQFPAYQWHLFSGVIRPDGSFPEFERNTPVALTIATSSKYIGELLAQFVF